MKRINRTIILSLFVAALFACGKEPEPETVTPGGEVDPEGYTLQTFTATSEDAKTTIDGGVTKWAADDQIKVVLNDGTAVNASLTAGANTTTGTFAGMVPNGKTALYAVYPAGAYSSVSGSTVNVSVPASQAGTFAAGNIAVAKVGDGNNMAFKNVNAFLVFQLKSGSEVTKVEVTSVDGGALAGTVPVDCSGDTPTPGAPTGTASTASMTTNGAGTYYLSVVPVSFGEEPAVKHTKGLKMTYYTGSQGNYTETGVYYLNKNLPIAVNNMFPLGEVDTERNYYVTVGGAGNRTGMDWANAFNASDMKKRVILAGTDADTDAAKLAAIDGATFHMGAGEYDLGNSPIIRLNESGANPVVLTFKGGYPAAGGTQDLSLYRADFVGDNNHQALRLRGVMNVSFEGIGFTKGVIRADNQGTLDLNASGEGTTLNVSMSYCFIGNNKNASADDATHEDHNQGAGLYLYNVSSFTADHVTFDNNSAYACSAAFIRDCNPVFTNCTFSNNVAYNKAAAVYTTGTSNSSVSASFTNCTFEDNESLAYQGAALQQNKGNNSFTNCTFTNNDSVDSAASGSDVGYGGAINVSSGDLTITGGTFSGNDGIWGGAIMYSCSNTLSISGTTFSGNTAKDGGALELGKGTVNITNCTFTDNEAFNDDADRTGEGEGAITYGYGGAIDAYSSVALSISGGSFSGNVAWRGGAINSNTSGGVTVTGTTFTDNGNANTRGGGAAYTKQATTFNNCTMGTASHGNQAKYGGAIEIVGGTTTVNGGSFESNSSTGEGGAISAEASLTVAKFNDSPASFINNYSGVSGGAVHAEAGTVSFEGAVFSGNSADTRGGAIHSTRNITLTDCTVSGNHAKWGGAIVVRNTKNLWIHGGTIENNYANTGGAILVDQNSNIFIDKNNGVGAVFSGNHTGNNTGAYGGAIRVESYNSTFSCDGASFNGNYTTYDGESEAFGGAISIIAAQSGVHADINDCVFDGNYSAGGGAPALSYQSGSANGDGTGYLRVSNTVFRDNHCDYTGSNNDNYGRHGGAVRLGHDATPSYFDNCTFTGNYTKMASSKTLSTWGGAVTYYADGMAYFNHCHFENNHATRGGAISAYNCTASGLYLNGCSFSGNYISFYYGTTIYVEKTKYFCMNNCSFSDDTYTTRSGGDEANWICIDGDSSAKALEECVISNCSIIGSARSTSSLNLLTNGQELIYILNMKSGSKSYLINNCIIASGTEQYAWWTNAVDAVGYNNVYSAKGNTGGSYTANSDTGNKTYANLGSPAWNSTTHVWPWNGTLSGGYTAISASDFATRMNTASSSFKAWLEDTGDLGKDQLGNDRGSGSWRPGAYQN